MPKFMAKCQSNGFQGRFWEQGQIADVPEGQMKDPALKHFRRLSEPSKKGRPRRSAGSEE